MKECKLNFVMTKAFSYCEDCKETYPTVEFGKTCPKCGGPHTYLVTGRDFMIKDVKVI